MTSRSTGTVQLFHKFYTAVPPVIKCGRTDTCFELLTRPERTKLTKRTNATTVLQQAHKLPLLTAPPAALPRPPRLWRQEAQGSLRCRRGPAAAAQPPPPAPEPTLATLPLGPYYVLVPARSRKSPCLLCNRQLWHLEIAACRRGSARRGRKREHRKRAAGRWPSSAPPASWPSRT